MSKRLLDILGASFGLVILLPILIIVAALVRHQLGAPVLFRQTRPGLLGHPFKMVKFRTMRDLSDLEGSQLADAERLTKMGQRLRSSSIDELPELWNVLKGEMSLV